MPRKEFDAATRLAAFRRCGGRCEALLPSGKRCGALLKPGRFRFDHDIPDAMGGKPELDNCVVRCLECDLEKTAADQKRIAKAKRNEAKHVLGQRKVQGLEGWRSNRVLPGSKNSGWKKTFNRGWVKR